MVEGVVRAFVAVDLDDETRHALATSMATLSIPGKIVPPRNWHITLRFIGTIDDVGLDRVVAGLDEADLGPRFEIVFGALGAFPKPRRATVLWRSISDRARRLPELAADTEQVCRDVGLEPEERPFRPHLTLSRIRPDRDVGSLIDGPSPAPVSLSVTEVCLFRSVLGGPHATYEVLERFPLT